MLGNVYSRVFFGYMTNPKLTVKRLEVYFETTYKYLYLYAFQTQYFSSSLPKNNQCRCFVLVQIALKIFLVRQTQWLRITKIFKKMSQEL